jgi:hypothetical protein
MAAFDYASEAALLPSESVVEPHPSRGRRGQRPIGYGRFARAADAIRFAIEELPASLLPATHLEVDEKKFDGDGIRRLYESAEYPLARRRASQWAPSRSH